MRLSLLEIRNFRKIDELSLIFPRGLSVIVGENNAGKTTIVDALRLMLFSSRDFESLRLQEDDFRLNSGGAPIEVSCTFSDLNSDDEVRFQECLVDIGDGEFEARINARAEFNTDTRRANVKLWGGETEGGSLPANIYDRLATIYLQPLRDPESGLKPGRYSQISRLINSLTNESDHGDFETIAREANAKIRELQPVKEAKADLDSQMSQIAGNELSQETELIFSDPAFHRIIAGLQPEIDGLPFSLNGLGYNNLVFTAATLGTLKRSEQYSHRSILVEEPEAHLHPQLQVLLLRHLANVAREKEGNEVQVIASSHSPILASQAPIDSIISVREEDGRVSAFSVCSLEYDASLKKKLHRFLDATRAELFFARRIIMVEGIAEALLLPVLARVAKGSIKDAAVTVLIADGINFNAFIPLFGAGKLTLPVVILTDGDDKDRSGTPSATASGLKAQEENISNLKVEFGEITFEHELARSPEMLPLMLDAFELLRPKLGPKLKEEVDALASVDEKADAFLNEFLRSETSKGRFAQELADVIESAEISDQAVPEYIRRAFEYLGVVATKAGDENGESTDADS